jgi:hypothetical protein
MVIFVFDILRCIPGMDPGFQVRGVHLKKLRRAEGGAKIVGVFRVKNHDFTPKNHIFSNFREGARRVRPPPWIRPCIPLQQFYQQKKLK